MAVSRNMANQKHQSKYDFQNDELEAVKAILYLTRHQVAASTTESVNAVENKRTTTWIE